VRRPLLHAHILEEYQCDVLLEPANICMVDAMGEERQRLLTASRGSTFTWTLFL
jgi:hypothetical protein